jgi:hypothetical protein
VADEPVSQVAAPAPAALSSPLSPQAPAPSASTAAPAASAASDPKLASPDTTSQTPTRPEGIPEDRWDPTANSLKLTPQEYAAERKRLGELETVAAAAEIKRLSTPKPEEYKADMPADLQLPDGKAYKVDETNPVVAELRTWAHENGLSQEQFSKLVGLDARRQAAQDAIFAERAKAEITKAGANAGQRVDVVGKWITGEMGEADAAPIRATLVTDAHLRFYEKIMNRLASQGTANFSQSHRAAPESGGIPGYEKMSFEQRRQAQDQNAARRRN